MKSPATTACPPRRASASRAPVNQRKETTLSPSICRGGLAHARITSHTIKPWESNA